MKVAVVAQQTPVWCWAATASMALELLGFPDINPAKNYQCGVVAAAFPACDDDCTKCVTALGSVAKLVEVLDRYRVLSIGQAKLRAGQEEFSPNYVAYPDWERIRRSLDLAYPVIAGISPDRRPSDPALSQHIVLITGYDDNYRGTGQAWAVVRDPFPYDAGTSPYAGYRFNAASGTVRLPWRILRDRMNLTSAVFLEKKSA